MPFDEALAEAGRLLDLAGVVGVGEGVGPDGEPNIVVMVTATVIADVAGIPAEIGGVPVEIVESGVVAAEPADEGEDGGDPRR